MAAKAPTPGVGKRKAAADVAAQIMTITVRGESVTIAPWNVPIAEQLIAKKATGLPVEEYRKEPLGMVDVVFWWWLARRASGEWQLTWARASEEWPADLNPDEFELTIDGPDEDATDPEA